MVKSMPAVLRNQNRKVILLLSLFVLLTARTAGAQSLDWAQWGGPHRDFKSEERILRQVGPRLGRAGCGKENWAKDTPQSLLNVACSLRCIAKAKTKS